MSTRAGFKGNVQILISSLNKERDQLRSGELPADDYFVRLDYAT
jgi:hypothetical protein